MAMWAKYEVGKITERKNYVEKDGIIYCTTMDYKTQATKPE